MLMPFPPLDIKTSRTCLLSSLLFSPASPWYLRKREAKAESASPASVVVERSKGQLRKRRDFVGGASHGSWWRGKRG